MARIGEICRSGATVFFVSHSTSSVAALCTRAMLIEGGRLMKTGSTLDVIRAYEERIHEKIRAELKSREGAPKPDADPVARADDSGVEIGEVRVNGDSGATTTVGFHKPMTIEVD